MKQIFATFAIVLFTIFLSCNTCEKEPKRYRTNFYTLTSENEYIDTNLLNFGINTEYTTWTCGGETKLINLDVYFSTDREIIIGNDTIPSKENLFKNSLTSKYVKIIEDETFYNDPQYILTFDNYELKLTGYYTFYFKAFTKDMYEINDSTIAYIY